MKKYLVIGPVPHKVKKRMLDYFSEQGREVIFKDEKPKEDEWGLYDAVIKVEGPKKPKNTNL